VPHFSSTTQFGLTEALGLIKDIAVNRKALKNVFLLLVAFTVSGIASAGDLLKLDASSDQTALDSFNLMLAELPQKKQEDLQFAVLKINMDGVGSAAAILADPALRSPSVARIKDRIAGMTADQILVEADSVTSIQMVRPSQ